MTRSHISSDAEGWGDRTATLDRLISTWQIFQRFAPHSSTLGFAKPVVRSTELQTPRQIFHTQFVTIHSLLHSYSLGHDSPPSYLVTLVQSNNIGTLGRLDEHHAARGGASAASEPSKQSQPPPAGPPQPPVLRAGVPQGVSQPDRFHRPAQPAAGFAAVLHSGSAGSAFRARDARSGPGPY